MDPCPHRPFRAALLLLLLPLGACGAFGGGSTAGPAPGAGPDRAASRPETGPGTIADALGDDAVRDEGLFTVHRDGEAWYFEIPDSLFGRDILFITRIAGVPPGFGGYLPAGASVAEQVMRLERRGDRILLRKISFREVAADSLPIERSVVQNNLPPVLAAFDVEGEDSDSTGTRVLIEVTDLFAGDTPALSPLRSRMRREYQVRRLDADRSFISRISSFPENVEVRHTQTFDAGQPPSDADTNTITVEASQSLVLLPADPMRRRYADPRVGYFSIERVNYGLDQQKAAEERFIRRWRLEPSDSAAYFRGELVEPVEPITWYVDPATPERWRRWVKLGVEDWNAAFEAAGFRNAVRALDPPSPDQDPEWDPEDVRYSVVRWAASTTRNAQGPSTSDPRSGEIIEADIVWYHNHLRSYRNWLMVQTGAAMPEARSLEIPEEVIGETMRQVIAHEIGHALGLPHNMISSSAYPTDSLRDADFASRMGVAPSIMDYARQNYIAQPGDGLEPVDFIRRIGPYDRYAVRWGYRHINTPDPRDEASILNRWIVDRADDPVYRYLPQSGGLAGVDPRAQTEDMGDDPVASSRYGLENLKRIVPRLPAWTATPGEGYDDLAELYGEAVRQYRRYVNHVVAVVGGAYVDLKSSDQEGVVFDGVPMGRQREAMRFLRAEVFTAPEWLNDRAILDRIGPVGRRDGLTGLQVQVLEALLSPARLGRLMDMQVLQPDDAYPVALFLDDLRAAVWPGVGQVRTIAPYRRALQRAWVERVAALMDDDPATGPFAPDEALRRSDLRPLLREQMSDLADDIRAGLVLVRERVTRAHLEDLLVRMQAVLEEADEG
jgi:hypothetical protein